MISSLHVKHLQEDHRGKTKTKNSCIRSRPLTLQSRFQTCQPWVEFTNFLHVFPLHGIHEIPLLQNNVQFLLRWKINTFKLKICQELWSAVAQSWTPLWELTTIPRPLFGWGGAPLPPSSAPQTLPLSHCEKLACLMFVHDTNGKVTTSNREALIEQYHKSLVFAGQRFVL